MDVTRMVGDGMMHDTCNTAQFLGAKPANAITCLRPQDDTDVNVYQGNCCNHICNILFGALEVMLDKRLEAHLKNDVELIPPHLCIACHLSELLIQVDKEYNFTVNNGKGIWNEFFDWKNRS